MNLINNSTHRWADDLRQELRGASSLRIAAAAFSIYAFDALREELEALDEVRFLFTSPAFTERAEKPELREFTVDAHPGPESVLLGSEFELRLRNSLTQRAVARECADWIRRKARFHASTYDNEQPSAVVDERVSYMGFRALTTPDLGLAPGGPASMFINKIDDSQQTRQLMERFDHLWSDPSRSRDITEEICTQVGRVFEENAPASIYFIILASVFAQFLEDTFTDAMPDDRTGYLDSEVWKGLYNFQRDGATGVINKLERFNGCVLADSVGLGKTYTALAVIKYYELRNKDVLVLAPKKLSDNWLTFTQMNRANPLKKDRFGYTVLAHTDLQRERGESMGTKLQGFEWGNFDLVVIDESHNFRNAIHHEDRETRYDALLRKVVQEGVRTKVLMLSATPVNNRFTDLRNQLNLALEGEPAAAARLGMDVGEVFRRAQAAFTTWSKLPAEERTTASILALLDSDFFSLLDAVTIARSRKQVSSFYDTTSIGAFPTRLPPISRRSPLSTMPDAPSFAHIAEQLQQLTLATYTPLGYVHASRQAKYEEQYGNVGAGLNRRHGDVKNLGAHSRELGIQRLMTTNLLKRLESSVEAFRLTLATVQHRIDADLAGLDTERSLRTVELSGEILEEDEEQATTMFASGPNIAIDLDDLDVISFRRDLEADQKIIAELSDALTPIGPDEDEKLRDLMRVIDEKVANPVNEGNRKVLIFSAFADTAEYLYQYVGPALERAGLHTALVTGGASPKSTVGSGLDFSTILTLFSPVSKNRASLLPSETREIDVLIATDCISEGQNLQDCDMVVNYDIHWNPVRIVQRFGRVDRLGSTNAQIQLVNFWPDVELDDYIHLVERVENRMRITDLTATGDDNVLDPGASDDAEYRAAQLHRLQNETIDLEDVRTGVSITDLGLNDFHLDLQRRLREDPGLVTAPRGLHAVVPADPTVGLVPGVIFALRDVTNREATRTSNRLHPHYLVYVDREGQVVASHRDSKQLLDVLRAACRQHEQPVPEAFEPFNEETADGADMTRYSRLLSQAVASIGEAEEESVVDSLFSRGPTARPGGGPAELTDVELTAFVVIR